MTKLKLLKEVYKPKESDIRKDIQKWLNFKCIFNWREWQGQFSVKGVPDIIGILPNGKILGIEVKLPGWKGPRTKHELEQADFHRQIRLSNGVAFFATSVEDVKSQLEIVRYPVSRQDPGVIDLGKAGK